MSAGAGRSNPGTGVVDGKVYVFGGNTGLGAVMSTEMYNPVTNSWMSRASMNHARGTPAGGAVNGKLYAAGGDGSGTAEVYDPDSNTWTDVAPMPAPRFYVGGGVVGSVLYVVGGTDASGAVLTTNNVQAYDTVWNTWSTKAPLPTPRMNPAVAVIAGVLYVIGGSQHSSGCDIQLDIVEAYDPGTNTWTTETSIPGRRDQAAAATSGSALYVTGGLKQDGCTSSFYADTEAFTLGVPPPPPVTLAPTADFTTTPNPAQAGQSLSFDGSASHDNDTVGCDPATNAQHCIASYSWAFGDSATQTASVPTTSHTYGAAGAYTATLTVTDNDGQTASLQHVIQVDAPPPPAPPPGCNTVGRVHGNQEFKTTVNGKKVEVHVEVDGDCDYDHKAKTVFLDHAKVKVAVGGGQPLINAKQDGKHSDVSSVTLTPATATTPAKAVIVGTWKVDATTLQPIPFTVVLTDGGKGDKNKNDTVEVTYPGFPPATLSAPHANVHIDFK